MSAAKAFIHLQQCERECINGQLCHPVDKLKNGRQVSCTVPVKKIINFQMLHFYEDFYNDDAGTNFL